MEKNVSQAVPLSLSDLLPNKLISEVFYFFRFFPIQEKKLFFFFFLLFLTFFQVYGFVYVWTCFLEIFYCCVCMAFAGRVVKAVCVNFVLFGYFICNKKGVKLWICFHFSENKKVIEYMIVCSGFFHLGDVVTYHWLYYKCTRFWRGKLEYWT